MASVAKGTMMREVSLTTARNLSPIFDEAVRREHPVVIVRGGRERGLLLAREAMLRVLAPYRFHVDVLPENDGGFTLWLNELAIGGSGGSVQQARRELLAAVRSYVANYFQQFDFYRHLPDLARLEPYVLRLSLAQDEAEILDMLFGAPAGDSEGDSAIVTAG
ncbi:MAG: hypothetical protein HY331_02925 [Chloroflexi bacterium]|nr:hypothetical protein [Chloroflexota bacterium]